MTLSTRSFTEACYALDGVQLRVMRTKDASMIAEGLIEMEPWASLQYSKEGLFNHLQSDELSLKRFTILVEDQIAGVVCVRVPWLLGPYLEILGLFKPFQGVGHGIEVLRWLKNEAFRSSKNLWTLVSSFNEEARRFYESFGFVQVAILPDLVQPGFNEILLRMQKEGRP